MYRARYWNRVKADDLDHGVDVFTFDWCVNAGPKRPSQALQRIIGATPERAIGPKTLQAAANFYAVQIQVYGGSEILVENLNGTAERTLYLLCEDSHYTSLRERTE